jgi:hypothetical protein
MRLRFPPSEVAFDPLGQFMRDPVERSEVCSVLSNDFNPSGRGSLNDFALCKSLCTIGTILFVPSYTLSYKLGSDRLLDLLG